MSVLYDDVSEILITKEKLDEICGQLGEKISHFFAQREGLSGKRVGILGLAFKPDTDDMRESPYVKVAKALIGEGVKIRIYDPHIHPDLVPAADALKNREVVLPGLICGIFG